MSKHIIYYIIWTQNGYHLKESKLRNYTIRKIKETFTQEQATKVQGGE